MCKIVVLNYFAYDNTYSFSSAITPIFYAIKTLFMAMILLFILLWILI